MSFYCSLAKIFLRLYLSTNKINFARLVHLELTKLCREANATYGFHTLTSITVAFIMMINNVFKIYLHLKYRIESDVQISDIVINFNWLLYFWMKTTSNSQFFTTVSRSVSIFTVFIIIRVLFIYHRRINNFQADKTGDIICELYDEDSVDENTKFEVVI